MCQDYKPKIFLLASIGTYYYTHKAMPKLPPDMILVDKPKGITSFDVIRALRRKYGVRKMGHAGTLDPAATGLMIVGIGEGTKHLREFLKFSKVYEAEVLLGVRTATGDMEGKVLEREPVPDFARKKIEKVIESIVGKITLPVPAYSAVKVRGARLYRLARRGRAPAKTPEKEMEIFWIRLRGEKREGEGILLSIELEVRSGTYIRSVAEEIGRRLGVPAAVKNLRRTKIGDFDLRDAERVE